MLEERKHKSRRNDYSRRSTQYPRPKDESRETGITPRKTMRSGKKQRIRCITQKRRLKGGGGGGEGGREGGQAEVGA